MKQVFYRGVGFYGAESSEVLTNFAFSSKKSLVAMNAEKFLSAPRELRGFITENIGYPDGEGALLAFRLLGGGRAVKMAGCDLWLKIIQDHKDAMRFYFVGSSPNVVMQVVEKLRKDFSGIQIVGVSDGYFSEQRKIELIADLRYTSPDLVFVAMGSPRQEQFIKEASTVHSCVYMGLGGSFDLYAGRSKRAPTWMIKLRLEWFYRLWCEPFRIVRMLKAASFFFVLLFDFSAALIGQRSSRLDRP